MALTVIARFEAEPGQEDRLRTELEALIEPTVDEPGCVAYELYIDPNRPGRMVVVEEWERTRVRDPYPRLAGLLARPVTVQLLQQP